MNDLTMVELTWIEKRVERWIRFGRTIEDQIIDRRRRIVGFAPGSIFAFARWASNDYGTIVSRIDIVRAVVSGEPCSTVPYVQPGGEILLRLNGWPKVEAALRAIDVVERLGIAPEDASPEHWRHVHNRLTAGEVPRPFTMKQHRAWLLRERVQA